MPPPLSPEPWGLPDEAVPFVREFILEVSRRLPDALAPPLLFGAPELSDAPACLAGCRTLLLRLDDVQNTMGTTMGELEDALRALLGAAQEIDAKLHRAIHQARDWVGEELAFSQALREVLEELRAGAKDERIGGLPLLQTIVRHIHAKVKRDQAEALALSREFDAVQEQVHGLRDRVVGAEAQTRRLLDCTLRDPLTGLWNHRAWEARYREEVSRVLRYGTPLSLAVWDVDHLKGINDAHGHRAGDAVLRELTHRVLGLLRGSDYLARLGGEEFGVLLPHTRLEGAGRVASKIRTTVERQPVEFPGGVVSVTVSIGVAQSKPGDGPQSLLDRAGHALARAKEAGQNQVGIDRCGAAQPESSTGAAPHH